MVRARARARARAMCMSIENRSRPGGMQSRRDVSGAVLSDRTWFHRVPCSACLAGWLSSTTVRPSAAAPICLPSLPGTGWVQLDDASLSSCLLFYPLRPSPSLPLLNFLPTRHPRLLVFLPLHPPPSSPITTSTVLLPLLLHYYYTTTHSFIHPVCPVHL